MKRLAFVLAAFALAAFALLLPGAARSAACSPLDCAPSQFLLARGTMLGFRTSANAPVTVVDLRTGSPRFVLPGGISANDLLVHQAGRTLVWYEATRGTRLHAVTLARSFRLVGVSQDGVRAVLQRADTNGTSFVIVSGSRQRSIRVQGKPWAFDALRGDGLFLIRYLATGGYQVRLVHVASGKLAAHPLKDPRESSTIWGQPFSRLASADGRYLFTLYLGSNGGAMVHELDLQTASARCIDLPGTGDYGSATSWALALSGDGRTLWAASPGYGRVVAIDVGTRKVTKAFRIDLPSWNLGNVTRAALAPGGEELALGDGETVAVVDLARHTVVGRDRGRATALGYSPSGTLWKLT